MKVKFISNTYEDRLTPSGNGLKSRYQLFDCGNGYKMEFVTTQYHENLSFKFRYKSSPSIIKIMKGNNNLYGITDVKPCDIKPIIKIVMQRDFDKLSEMKNDDDIFKF